MHRAGTDVLAAALAIAAAAAGCYHQADPPAPLPAPSASVDTDPGWPVSLELTMVEKSDVLKHGGLAMFSVETRLPVFRSEPPGIAAALNAKLARLARPDVDPRTHEGSYSFECSAKIANRFAVLLDCAQLLDERTHEEAEQGTGGGPAEPQPLVFGWWLRRGLPDLSIEQFAPRFDLRAAIDAAAASAPADCDVRSCGLDPKSFLLDGDGLALVATEPCGPACEGVLPAIPLDELHPTHAWASELVTRIRRRVEAGNELVEGERRR
ncbi:MAG TPA: hypothetical protein VN253_28595 [Kofleriaceae bacterium]|nr:hypothetical protein [Kofleriaceae bacterium]